MVLMHDADIKRTTNASGLVSEYTHEELQRFNLKDIEGNITPYKIPTILEMFEWGKDKTVFNLDNKDNGPHTWNYYIQQLNEGGEWFPYKNIILSVRSLKEAMYYWENGVNDRMFCVEISSMEHFEAYDRSPIPWNRIMAYIRLTVNPEQEELYLKLHEKGVSIMTSIHPTTDRVANKADRHSAYLRELVAMPDIIETDRPSEFVDLPLSRDELRILREKAVKRVGY
jgi:glycerophosphoryl diester phosphodiesterase